MQIRVYVEYLPARQIRDLIKIRQKSQLSHKLKILELSPASSNIQTVA